VSGRPGTPPHRDVARFANHNGRGIILRVCVNVN
jgi:hypothetical protein